ncbi:MAG: Lrp/AsnC family transcriptional regulator [Pseudomonadota bacterium]
MEENSKNLYASGITTIDREILRALQNDGRMTNAELAKKVGLSPAACHKRVKRLEADGTIKHYCAVIDRRTAGYPQSVFVQITLEGQGSDALEAFELAVVDYPEIIECHLMTGAYDYLLHVITKDAEEYESLHRDILTKLPGVSRLTSSFALRTVRQTSEIPIHRN